MQLASSYTVIGRLHVVIPEYAFTFSLATNALAGLNGIDPSGLIPGIQYGLSDHSPPAMLASFRPGQRHSLGCGPFKRPFQVARLQALSFSALTCGH